MGRSPALGLLVAAGAIALTTLLLYPLREIAPAVSLGVLYLLAVLLVATVWSRWLALATAVGAALAFNFFHIPPTGRVAVAQAEDRVALLVFVVAAVVASNLSLRARERADEAERRRREADLAAGLARLLLGTLEPRAALAPAAKQIADALRVDSASVVLAHVESDERHAAIPLGDIGTLLVPTAAEEVARERVAPALEALLRAALEREALTNEVVETSALRRSDEIKTAVLRSVSHDLRSPLTAIVAAGDALSSTTLSAPDRIELIDAIAHESRRLARLVDQLLDLSRLQSGTAEPHEDWCSLEEVIRAAVDDTDAPERVKLVLAGDLPLIRADAGQLRRAIANLIENALRYGADQAVSVRARVSGGRILLRIVDQGPGIAPAEHERIFTPFYRGPGAAGQGSGLGLAIVRGLIEANGGRVRVESLPGQGTSFVVELPLPTSEPVACSSDRSSRASPTGSSDMRELRIAIVAAVVLTVVLGLVYPLAMTGVAQVVWPDKADGDPSLVARDHSGDPGLFQSRPSVTGYATDATFFNNQGPNQQALADQLKGYVDAYLERERPYDDGLVAAAIPPDAVTTSASGIDPHISAENAEIQARRVAEVSGLPLDRVLELVDDATSRPLLGLAGPRSVNVVTLNRALEAQR